MLRNHILILVLLAAVASVSCDDDDTTLAPSPTIDVTKVADIVNGAVPIEPDVWHEGRDMPTPRAEVASAIIDGKIYIVGGFTSN